MCSHAGEWIGEWNDLESEAVTYTVLDIMTDNQSEEIEKELGVTFSSALGGKLVYISGQSEESFAGAQKKLSVMLAIKVSRRKQCFPPKMCSPICLRNCYLARCRPRMCCTSTTTRIPAGPT